MESNRGAAALRAWMDEHHHNQATVATMVGTVQQNVSNWLAGRAPSLARAIVVREVTGIPVEAWFEVSEGRRRKSA